MKLSSIATFAFVAAASTTSASSWQSNHTATSDADSIKFDAGLFTVAVIEQPASCGIIMTDSLVTSQLQWTWKRLVKRGLESIDEEADFTPSASLTSSSSVSGSSKALLTPSESFDMEVEAPAKPAVDAVSSPKKGKSKMGKFWSPIKNAMNCVGEFCAQMAVLEPQYYGLADAQMARYHGYSPTGYPPRPVERKNPLEELERLQLEEATRNSLMDMHQGDSPTLQSGESIKTKDGHKELKSTSRGQMAKDKGPFEYKPIKEKESKDVHIKPIKVREHEIVHITSNGRRVRHGSSSRDVVEEDDWKEDYLMRKAEYQRNKQELELDRIKKEKQVKAARSHSSTVKTPLRRTARQAVLRPSRFQLLTNAFKSEPIADTSIPWPSMKKPSALSDAPAHQHNLKRSTHHLVKRAVIPEVRREEHASTLSSQGEAPMQKRNGGHVHALLAMAAKTNPHVATYVDYKYGSKHLKPSAPTHTRPSTPAHDHPAAPSRKAGVDEHGSHKTGGAEHDTHKTEAKEHDDKHDAEEEELDEADFPTPLKTVIPHAKTIQRLDDLEAKVFWEDRWKDMQRHGRENFITTVHDPDTNPALSHYDRGDPHQQAIAAARKKEVDEYMAEFDEEYYRRHPFKTGKHHDQEKDDHHQSKSTPPSSPRTLTKSHSFSGRSNGPFIKKDDANGPELKKTNTFKKDEWGSMVDHLVKEVSHSKKPKE